MLLELHSRWCLASMAVTKRTGLSEGPHFSAKYTVLLNKWRTRLSFFYKMLYWINWIVLLALEPLAGELEYASVEWSAAGAWVGRVSIV